jgi:hypothetical protein
LNRVCEYVLGHRLPNLFSKREEQRVKPLELV